MARIKRKIFSLMIRGGFAEFGKKSIIVPPVRLNRIDRIKIGNGILIGANSWLQTIPDGDNISAAISIGDGTGIVGNCTISAARQVTIQDGVLIAGNVYISDHKHRFSDKTQYIQDQGIDQILPVLVKRGAWIGQNVVICPGVTIGVGAVIGANSFVNRDVPDFCVAAGSPARVIKRF